MKQFDHVIGDVCSQAFIQGEVAIAHSSNIMNEIGEHRDENWMQAEFVIGCLAELAIGCVAGFLAR